MAQRVIDGFILEEAAVLCPECQTPFRTEVMVETRGLNSTDVVEADMHRVFPSANLRGNLLSLCPECKFCAWTSQFAPYNIRPELIRTQGDIVGAKKYALAVKWAREKKQHSLDIAFIALNGLWCARESGEPDQLWLELSLFEHEKGLESSFFVPEDNGMTHLIMAELYRQSRNFEAAAEHYKLAAQDKSIIKEILEHQMQLCAKGASSVTALPLRIVRLLFNIAEDGANSKEMSVTDAAVVFQPKPSKNEARTLTAAERAARIPDAPMPKAVANNVVPLNANQPKAQPAPATKNTNWEIESEDEAPLVAAISAVFSSDSALLKPTAKDQSATAAAAETEADTVQPISARIAAAKQTQAPQQTPGQRETNPTSTPPAMAPVQQPAATSTQAVSNNTQASNVSIAIGGPKAPQQEEKPIDPANVIEISAFDPKAESKKQNERPNSAARSAALNARAKSVEQAQPQAAAQPATRSRRRATRKDRRSSERTPGSQNVRQDHRVTRLPLSTGVVNAKGWITDYSTGVSSITPQSQAAPAPSNYEEGLHDYEIVGEEEPKKLPELDIDDPNGYRGEDVPDHTNAISQVENYLSFSRKLYQRSYMRGYN